MHLGAPQEHQDNDDDDNDGFATIIFHQPYLDRQANDATVLSNADISELSAIAIQISRQPEGDLLSKMVAKCNEIDMKIELNGSSGIDRQTSLENLTTDEANAYTLFKMYSEDYE